MRSLHLRSVAVVGVAMTKFDKHPDRSVEDLARQAVVGALRDAGVEKTGVEAAYVGHLYQGEVLGQRILRGLGFPPIPVLNVENACASGSSALREAWIAVGAGLYDVALVVGAEKMRKGLLQFVDRDLEVAMGNTAPAQYALAGRRHMEEFGTSREQFAQISVKNHRHGCLNPHAQYQTACTLEEVLSSRLIADPLTLLQCCPAGSGAAAVVVATDAVARRLTTLPVWIRAAALRPWMSYFAPTDLTSFGATAVTARDAYAMAGVGPEDLDVVELHDAFTVGELLHCEGLGLCAKGEGGRLVAEGATELAGRIPVNPSGGLLAKGHPLGATGVAQVVELVWHLRGQAGARQVPGARVGLAHSQGGTGLEAGACTVTILGR
ncbi:MAG: thiolase family protein [Candidatus Rokuibacteriota bacterium]